ncbi:primase C-terminal domain-containing protein (plasmid) [Pararoseomonas sp. SCSIO 73927]|uniref:primase C-terminal domain-containing protein n=1 Tax=Pararoseomonas sp. SCSIO 73927 TaxID=3114537 RepID=UPI0030D50EF2
MPLDALLDLPPLTLGTAPAVPAAPWHAARPHLLASALSAADAAAPHLHSLARHLLPWAPRRPSASQDLRSISRSASTAPLLLDSAVTCPWLSWDAEEARNVLAIDIDHADGPDLVADLAAGGLPRPTLTIDPWSGRSHATWRLATPVAMGDGSRVGPRILADLAARLLAAALRGTPLPHRAPTKSPWGRVDALVGLPLRRGTSPAVPAVWEGWQEARTGLLWHTEPGDLRPVELREIVAALADDYGEEAAAPATVRRIRRRRGDPSALGRNCALFDVTRWWAYDRAERDGGAILAHAQAVNAGFADPLPASEVAATARSIARFMSSRYRPRTGAEQVRRGRDRDTAGADLKARRAIAGQRSAAARRASSVEAATAAIRRLAEAGQPATQATVAKAAGLSERTVRTLWLTLPTPALAPMHDPARRCVSGSAAAPAAPGAPEGTPPVLHQIPSDSAPFPHQNRSDAPAPPTAEARLAAVLAVLQASARESARRGAAPAALPDVPTDLERHPEVRRLRRLAADAAAGARRRAEARQARHEAGERRADMASRLRADPRAAWSWWRDTLATLDEEWDLRQLAAEEDGDSRRADLLRAQRDTTMSARWSQWRAAVRAAVRDAAPPVRRDGIPAAPDAIDLLIPW